MIRITLIHILFVLLISAPHGWADETPVLGMQLVESRIALLRASGAEDVDDRVQQYVQVRNLLAEAESHLSNAQRYLDAVSSAPARMADIQLRLDASATEFDAAAAIEGFREAAPSARRTLARTQQREVESQVNTLDQRLASREGRIRDIQARLAEIDSNLAEFSDESQSIVLAPSPSLAEAQQWLVAAKSLSLEAERRMLQAELSSQPARYSLMSAERALLDRRLEDLAQLVMQLELEIATAPDRNDELRELGLKVGDPAYEAAKSLMLDIREVRLRRMETSRNLVDVRARTQSISQKNQKVRERYALTRQVVDIANDSESLGQILFGYWEDLDGGPSTVAAESLSASVGGAVITRMQYEQSLAELTSRSEFLKEQFGSAVGEEIEADAAAQRSLETLVGNYRDLLREAIVSETDYVNALGVFENSLDAYIKERDEFRSFLSSRLLWIANHSPLWGADFEDIAEEVVLVLNALNAIEIRFHPYALLALLLAGALQLNAGRLLEYQRKMNAQIVRPRGDAIRFTIQALSAVLLRALVVPLVIVAIIASIDATASAAGYAVNSILGFVALLVFFLVLLRYVAEPEGVGELHFGWPVSTLTRVRDELGHLLLWWIPLTAAGAIAAPLARLGSDSVEEVLGRSLIFLSMLIVLTHFSGHILRELRETGFTWFSSLINQARVVMIVLIAVMAGALVYGHLYSLRVIVGSLIDTVWIGVILLLLQAVLMRWIRVTHRRLRMQELLLQRSNDADKEEGVGVTDQAFTIGDISSDTRQLLQMATAVGAIAAIIWIWGPLLPAFDVLSNVVLWTSTVEVEGEPVISRITLATLLTVAVVGVLTVFLATRLPALVEIVLRSRTDMAPGTRYTISTLLSYLIVSAGALAGLAALGLRWEQLQWLVAALSVGIGFGLQEVVANFVSGLIILFERPIRVGDVITVGEKDGIVTRVRIRATTLRDWDGKELLIPNKELITRRVLNWSLSDSQTRLVIPIGIAYGSDIETAVRLLRDIVVAHPQTLDEPAPQIVFENFGDNALELSARAFIATIDARLAVMTELRTSIYHAFNDAGISIAFPQRDVHLSTQQPLAITINHT